jgi:carbon monoxide dehydrogenase subunit G
MRWFTILVVIHSGTFLVPCRSDDVFDLLATPEQFAPLLPDYESMAMQDATRFHLRTAIAVGKINGHANFAMELIEATRPSLVVYAGQGVIAGGKLLLKVHFTLQANDQSCVVNWQGEVMLDRTLALFGGDLLDTRARLGFEKMAERVRLRLLNDAGPPSTTRTPSDYEI